MYNVAQQRGGGGGCKSNAPINLNLLQSPRPHMLGLPQEFYHFPCLGSRTFDVNSLPGSGRFELYSGGVGSLNLKM